VTIEFGYLEGLRKFVGTFPQSIGIRQILVDLATKGYLSEQNSNETLPKWMKDKVEVRVENRDYPSGWKVLQLKDLGKIYNGSSLSDSEKKSLEKNKAGIPYLGTKDVGYASKNIDYQNGWLVPYENEQYKRAPKGSLLICLEGGSAGKKMGIVDREVCFGNKMFAIQLHEGVLAEYLQLVYQSSNFQAAFTQGVNGIIAGISKAKFEIIAIPIPPVQEQARIIEVFEILLLEFESGAKAVNQAEKILSQTRNSFIEEIANKSYGEIFKYKVAKLIENWTDYSGDLEGISKLRRCFVDLVVRGAFSEGFFDLVSQGANNWELPSGWDWVPIRSVIDPERGLSYGIIKLGKEPKVPGVPVLRCSDVKYRGFDLTGMRTVDPVISQQYSRTVLHGGEVLVNIRGTLGGCAIVPSEYRGYNIAREVAVMQPSKISPEFLLATLSSDYFTQHVLNSLRGISYKGMNLSLLGNTLIPLPPKNEEIRLVSILNQLMDYCNELEEALKKRQMYAELLEASLSSELLQAI
jgi:type I restriction enzyme S subunit